MIAETPSISVSSEMSGGQSRVALRRVCDIHHEVRRGRFPNCSTLAASLEVAPKTIQRDIRFMREELELPLAYHDKKHGYHYTKPVGEFPLVRATVEDLVAVFLAQAALSSVEGNAIEQALRESFRRISASLSGEVTFRWSDLDEAFSVRAGSVGTLTKRDIGVFEKLARAVLDCRRITFDYRKLDSADWESRSLHPYHLVEVDGGWYVIGFDPNRSAKRTFAVQRMKGLRVGT